MRRNDGGGLVYSTDGGRTCPTCRKPLAACVCKAAASAPRSGDGIVRVNRETKGRGGKSVTVIRGVPLDAAELSALGKSLRASCGAGGTVKDGVLEIQGDHCDRVTTLLAQRGWTVRRSGA